MRLIWDNRAKRDYLEIISYIAERNPAAARRLEDSIARTLEFAIGHPFMYRPGRVPGTREAVVHPNYLIVYQVGEHFIKVIRVLHARQNYP